MKRIKSKKVKYALIAVAAVIALLVCGVLRLFLGFDKFGIAPIVISGLCWVAVFKVKHPSQEPVEFNDEDLRNREN